MHPPETTLSCKRILLAVATLALAISAQAQQSTDANVPPAALRQQMAELAKGDPPRWDQEDRSMAERLRTIRKETAAGLQENLGVCRAGPRAERAACMQEARSIYQLEMAGAKARAASGQ